MVARCSGGWPRAQEKLVNLEKRNEVSGKSVQINLAFYICQCLDGI